MTGRPSLIEIVRELGRVYGNVSVPELTPFELILLENASYLVDDDRRWAVFEKLRSKVGVTPEAILAADAMLLMNAIADGGMKAPMRAEKVRECARIALEIGPDILEGKVRERAPDAKRLLQRFPGIGEPSADKIMLLCAAVPSLAPDSNALRVLERLGYVPEESNYARQYRMAIKATRERSPLPKRRSRRTSCCVDTARRSASAQRPDASCAPCGPDARGTRRSVLDKRACCSRETLRRS